MIDVQRELNRIPNLEHRIELLNIEIERLNKDYESLLASFGNYKFKAGQLDSLMDAVREIELALKLPWWKRYKMIKHIINSVRYLYDL